MSITSALGIGYMLCILGFALLSWAISLGLVQVIRGLKGVSFTFYPAIFMSVVGFAVSLSGVLRLLGKL